LWELPHLTIQHRSKIIKGFSCTCTGKYSRESNLTKNSIPVSCLHLFHSECPGAGTHAGHQSSHCRG
jgi:hypothetical protein